MILLFSVSFIAEANIMELEFHGQEALTVDFETTTDQDCQEKKCHDKEGHCSHHCSGLHHITGNNTFLYFTTPNNIQFKTIWDYRILYKSPLLDSNLKPPMAFS